MATIHTYLNFNGNTEEAFDFYKSVFGGEYAMLQRFSDTGEGDKMPEPDKNKIMHIALSIGGTMLMGTDVLVGMMPAVTFGTAGSISVDVDSEDEAHKIFDGLAAGAKISMPLEKMFWGALFGMLTDKFGVQWMVNYDFNKGKA